MAGKTRVPRRLRERVARAAGYCCGYCRTRQSIAGFRLTVEHIIPEAKGGETVEQNLWLACHACNEFKGARVQGRDPSPGSASDCGTRDSKNGSIIFRGLRPEPRSWV
jgi:5-methylcytosine-specific restriction endonuclease McrA